MTVMNDDDDNNNNDVVDDDNMQLLIYSKFNHFKIIIDQDKMGKIKNATYLEIGTYFVK
jgi:predicted component of type VI protein secretion system